MNVYLKHHNRVADRNEEFIEEILRQNKIHKKFKNQLYPQFIWAAIN